MTKIALNHGATIDKYIGDAVSFFFGDPETKGEREDARACGDALKDARENGGVERYGWNEGFMDPFQI